MPYDDADVTGALRIDNEHATLSRMLEGCTAICAIANAASCATACPVGWQDKCSSDLETLVAALTAYMHQHFHYEERRMDDCVVEDLFLEHRDEHRRIASQIESIIERHRQAELDVVSTAAILGDSLSRWLHDHIERHDQVLMAFLLDCGGPEEPLD